MRSTNTSEQKNNNQAKSVFLRNNSSDNSFSDNSFSSDNILLAMKKSFDKERSREFMKIQKLLFKRSNQQMSFEFKRVKEIFNIDSIDIYNQTIDIVM